MTHSRKFLASAVCITCCLANHRAFAASGQPVNLTQRVRGAERVVVATAKAIRASWRQNSHGDRLIVSEVLLQVEETLKGAPVPSAWLELEGGTLNGFTLRVSDLPVVEVGDRAVFFLDRTDAPTQVPHLRGQGVVKLDRENRAIGSNLRLEDIRRAAQGAAR